ncbi:hypothetical protein WJX73_007260 [Symbiochloris irregularis]|uniref:Molybdopterin synthase catalytic subunit n=1 Tax=Symbiochloris irregularis TaxID=706552 RepID=A0AAW1PPS8_9CHLO
MSDKPQIWVQVTDQPLGLEELTRKVASDSAGAIATFSGVTRNSFKGKAVTKLEYEAYVPMAEKQLQEVCQRAGSQWQVQGLAVAHRTGTVLVGEASVVIAASSAHRKDALEACAWVIDELKATVPIWKREYFADGSVWKENAESRGLTPSSH